MYRKIEIEVEVSGESNIEKDSCSVSPCDLVVVSKNGIDITREIDHIELLYLAEEYAEHCLSEYIEKRYG